MASCRRTGTRQDTTFGVLLLMALVAPTLLCVGCVSVSLRIVADHRFQDAPLPLSDHDGIRVGDRIDLTLKDGSHVRGYFREVDCGSDSCLVLGPYAGSSWDDGFGRADTQRIRISEIQNARIPNHSFERQALAVGIFIDAVLTAVLVSWMLTGLQGIGI